MSLAPFEPAPLKLAGDFFSMRGDFATARPYYERFLAIAPRGPRSALPPGPRADGARRGRRRDRCLPARRRGRARVGPGPEQPRAAAGGTGPSRSGPARRPGRARAGARRPFGARHTGLALPAGGAARTCGGDARTRGPHGPRLGRDQGSSRHGAPRTRCPRRCLPTRLPGIVAGRRRPTCSPDRTGVASELRRLDRPNLVLVVVDTLRADWTTAYDPSSPLSPELAAWARRGVVFERTRAQSSWTKVSMASMMTSLWPRSHGIRLPSDGLSSEAATLASVLGEHGYATYGVQSNGWLEQSFGFHHGFDRYVFPRPRSVRDSGSATRRSGPTASASSTRASGSSRPTTARTRSSSICTSWTCTSTRPARVPPVRGRPQGPVPRLHPLGRRPARASAPGDRGEGVRGGHRVRPGQRSRRELR